MANLPRRGRPPRVTQTDRGVATVVKGNTYEFTVNDKGNLVPTNTRVGNRDDREYAKTVIKRNEQTPAAG